MLCWNARVVTSDKLIQHDASHRLHQFDIISITETGAATPDILQQHFPTHTVFHLPCAIPGQKGAGIAVLISSRLARHTHVELKDPDVSCLCLRIKAAATHLTKDLLVATCYIPPENSNQLRQCPLECRFQRLLQHSASLSPSGHLLVCGDFNARIADLDDLPTPAPPSIQPHQRCCQDMHVNAAGHLFIEVCQAVGLGVLTGRAH
jgi:exonuclease III